MRVGNSAEATKGKNANYIHSGDQCRSQGTALNMSTLSAQIQVMVKRNERKEARAERHP